MEVFQFHESLLCEGLFHECGIIVAGRCKKMKTNAKYCFDAIVLAQLG